MGELQLMARFSRSEHKELTQAVKLFNEKIPELKKQGIYKDYRLPENREECFNRYFGYRVTTYDLDHTHYLTVLSEGYSDERKAWLALLFGMTYRTPQAFAYAETFDNPNDIDLKELDIWHDKNYHRCTYGTDARYNKGKFHLQIRSMKEWLGNMTVLEKIHSIIDNPELKTDFDRFKALYSSINTMYRFGRMTGWLALQGLYDLLKLPIDPHQILIEGYNPSKDASLGSIWNGLCMLKNMTEKLLSQYGNYKCTPEDLVWGEKELVEAVRKAQEYNGLYDIDSFRLESIYCQYKRMYHEGMSFEYPGHASGDATSRYLFYREHWPEIDWSKFRRALRTQPGILKGQTFVPWKNQFFGQTGALMSVHERFDDMPDIWDICELDPQQYLVKELWTDDNLPVPTSLELRTSYWKDLETAPKYWKEK